MDLSKAYDCLPHDLSRAALLMMQQYIHAHQILKRQL